ncbi:MAG: GtrA family protein [Prevotella sp.]|nr:GtrA family protein [Prevotella sp.]
MRFGVVGVVATAIHYGVYYVLLAVLSPTLSYTIGYAVSFCCNYVLSSRFTFRVGLSVGRAASFGVSHVLNYLIGVGLLNAFIALGVSSEIAPLPVFVLVVPINYLLVRFALTHKLLK